MVSGVARPLLSSNKKKIYYIRKGAVYTKFTGLKKYKGHVYSIRKGIVVKKVR